MPLDPYEKLDESELIEQEKTESKNGAVLSAFKSFFNFLKTVVLVVAIALVIRVFIVQPFVVEGQSMEPTFNNADYLITEKVSYRFHNPQRGEIVIFHPPDSPSVNYIKRVIGLPGETVETKDNNVLINGQKLTENYLFSAEDLKAVSKDGQKLVLGQDQYFVMGDNRNHSRDSREIGAITKEEIVSRVWFRLLPISHARAFAALSYKY